MSLRDALTGLLRPEQAQIRLDRWVSDADNCGCAVPVHAMLLSLRRIDTINLAFGETVGDSVLVEVANRLQHFADEEFGREWLAARLGGGNFLLAMHQPCSREKWEALAGALVDAITNPIGQIGSSDSAIRLSPRLAMIRVTAGDTAHKIMDRLAQTLAQMESQQTAMIAWCDGEAPLVGRTGAELEADLLLALDRDEIEILYQPQFTVSGRQMMGAEALARWHHPVLGCLGAGVLFGIAERAGQLAHVSRHVIRRALGEAAHWPAPLRLSLNITPQDLVQISFLRDLEDAISSAGFQPARLTLEIVEQSLLGDLDRSAKVLKKLTRNGVRVALDDFGAGFCNFRYLKTLPLHYLKLDRSMVDGITQDPRDLAVLRGIIAMAKALDLEVLVEGVEDEEQLRLIAAEGCDYLQGFLFAQPMDGAQLQAFIADETARLHHPA